MQNVSCLASLGHAMTVVGNVLPGSTTHVLLASALMEKCRSKWGDKNIKTREAAKEAFSVCRESNEVGSVLHQLAGTVELVAYLFCL